MFFANSGIAWPKLEQQTREAGTDALEAASELWRLFARLEAREPEPVARAAIDLGARRLDNAARIYSSIASELDGRVVDGLSPAEREMAAVRIGHIPYYEEWPLERLELMPQVPISELYRELSRRTNLLASALRTFEPNRENRDLAPQVFGMMRQWETVATLGRVIAVLNRRPVEFRESQS